MEFQITGRVASLRAEPRKRARSRTGWIVLAGTLAFLHRNDGTAMFCGLRWPGLPVVSRDHGWAILVPPGVERLAQSPRRYIGKGLAERRERLHAARRVFDWHETPWAAARSASRHCSFCLMPRSRAGPPCCGAVVESRRRGAVVFRLVDAADFGERAWPARGDLRAPSVPRQERAITRSVAPGRISPHRQEQRIER